MANFTQVSNLVTQVLDSVTASVSVQGEWYWREAVRRAMQDFRETGTPKVYPLTAGSASTYVAIDANPARLFGVLVENTHSSALCWGLYNSATPTVGTSVLAAASVPATSVQVVTFDDPYVFSTALTWAATTTVVGSTQTNGTLIKLAAIYTV